MRNLVKLSVLLIFLLVGLFVFSTRETEAKYASTDTRASEGVVSPKSIYRQNCARCHGVDGRAQTALGKKLDAEDLTTEKVKGFSNAKIIRTITKGRGDMPAFGKKLSSKQITSLAGYVRSL